VNCLLGFHDVFVLLRLFADRSANCVRQISEQRLLFVVFLHLFVHVKIFHGVCYFIHQIILFQHILVRVHFKALLDHFCHDVFQIILVIILMTNLQFFAKFLQRFKNRILHIEIRVFHSIFLFILNFVFEFCV
jgi:hypothetical protein